MKQIKTLSIYIVLFITFALTSCSTSENSNNAAHDVLQRTFGEHGDKFRLVLIEDTDAENDWFKIDVQNNVATIEANSQVALTKGAYHYLKEAGLANISWEGNRIDIPAEMPNYSSATIESSVKYRMYLNQCAFGYTTVWWDWDRWEKEIDWMALHGINNPLISMGQEAIWQEVWASFGISKEELSSHFTGPAFLPWFRMGNINKHGGALPQSYIDNDKELQKKIINRMRELGMKPIVPAFSGYVPRLFMEKFPEAKIHTMDVWSGFDDSHGTYLLDPKDPNFKKIGQLFIKKYKETYGEAAYFLADSFNEMKPPVSEENKHEELAEYGKIIYNTIAETDPNATWVMQGWLFGHDSEFWSPAAIKAFLSEVPKDKIIIQNFGEDRYPVWEKLDGFYGYNWLYGYVHNYGATNPVYGDLNFYHHAANKLINAPNKGSLLGYGAIPEGIENNSAVYEYIYDIPWDAASKTVDEWVAVYLKSRYGNITPEIELAWQTLNNSTYNVKYWDLRWTFSAGSYLHNKRPTTEIAGFNDFPGNPNALQSVITAYLNELDKYNNNDLYFYDLVEFARHFIAYKADMQLVAAVEAYLRKDYTEGDTHFDKFKNLLVNLDTLLMANDLSLEKWCKAAMAYPGTDEDKLLYLRNAKTQVTIWGGDHLYDYASKEWSGLVGNFYLPRWEMFFDEMKSSGNNFDEAAAQDKIRVWEEKWASNPTIPQSAAKQSKEQYVDLIKTLLAE